jgi:hypothetical protein
MQLNSWKPTDAGCLVAAALFSLSSLALPASTQPTNPGKPIFDKSGRLCDVIDVSAC